MKNSSSKPKTKSVRPVISCRRWWTLTYAPRKHRLNNSKLNLLVVFEFLARENVSLRHARRIKNGTFWGTKASSVGNCMLHIMYTAVKRCVKRCVTFYISFRKVISLLQQIPRKSRDPITICRRMEQTFEEAKNFITYTELRILWGKVLQKSRNCALLHKPLKKSSEIENFEDFKNSKHSVKFVILEKHVLNPPKSKIYRISKFRIA